MPKFPKFTNDGKAPGQDDGKRKKKKGEKAPDRLFSEGSQLNPTKEKNEVGVSGFGRDTSDKTTFSASAFHRNDEVNPYAEEVRRRDAVEHRFRVIVAMVVVLLLVFLLALILPSGVFENLRDVSPAWISTAISTNVHNVIALFTDPGSAGSEEAIFSTYLCIVFAGAALGMTGAIYQGSMRNALASPSTLGVDVGSQAGASVYLLLFGGASASLSQGGFSQMHVSQMDDVVASMDPLQFVWATYGQALCSILGAFDTILLVVTITLIAGRGKFNGTWLIVTGTIVILFMSVPLTLAQQYFTDMHMYQEIQLMEELTVTAFAKIKDFSDVAVVCIPLAVIMIFLFMIRIKLGLLTFGDDEARSLGINPSRLRILAIGLTTAMSALIVAFCGSVSFLGFLVPHVTRRFIGSDFRYLLPASALTGSIVLVACYCVMSMISSAASNLVGILTSIIGLIVFVAMFVKQRGGESSVQL